MGENAVNGRANNHASAMQSKKTIFVIERNAFNPVPLIKIGADAEEAEKKKTDEIQENLGPEIIEKETKAQEKIYSTCLVDSHTIERAKQNADLTKDTSELEYLGDKIFKTGQPRGEVELYKAVDVYGHAALIGSKTAKEKLFDVAMYVFTKEHGCDSSHATSGCKLRNKTIMALSLSGSKEDLYKIGEYTESKQMYHCAVNSYKEAVRKGSLEARRRLLRISKLVKDPYLANVALAYALMGEEGRA